MELFNSSRTWLFSGILVLTLGCQRAELTQPLSTERIEASFEHDGSTHFLADDGNLYREATSSNGEKAWELITKVYDPDEVRRSYVSENGVTYRVDPDTQRRFEVLRELNESFDDLKPGIPGIIELCSEQRMKWGSLTLQSPKKPTVPEYVELRKKLLSGEADFLDCRVEPTTERMHSGSKSLKCVAAAKPSSMITCKASISSPLVYFRNEDDFWYEAYYWADGSLPMTLIDLECEFVQEHPGIRLRIFDDGALGVELKALDKPQYRQDPVKLVAFPKGQWVCVKVHFHLSPTAGTMEVWQDGIKVLDRKGITLPFRSAIYNSLEIGISAHGNPSQPCTLFVDDLRCSTREFDSP